jgi:hypothetical protein
VLSTVIADLTATGTSVYGCEHLIMILNWMTDHRRQCWLHNDWVDGGSPEILVATTKVVDSVPLARAAQRVVQAQIWGNSQWVFKLQSGHHTLCNALADCREV